MARGRLSTTRTATAGRPTSRHYLYKPDGASTFYALLLLRDFGLPPDDGRARKACHLLLDEAMRADGGITPLNDDGTTPSETCVTGMALSILSYFELDDARLDTVAQHLLDQQMADGGWNCQRVYGARHSSMHTTILALEGLRHYELHRRQLEGEVRAAQDRGRGFLLAHRLFRSHRTGEVIDPKTQHAHVRWPPFTVFTFPTQWHYDIVRALDHFQAVAAPRDGRLAEAIEIVKGARRDGGHWPLEHRWEPPTYVHAGAPRRTEPVEHAQSIAGAPLVGRGVSALKWDAVRAFALGLPAAEEDFPLG